MKVIEKGREQKGWAKEYKCTGSGNGKGGCAAILLVEQEDLFSTYSSSMGRDESYYVTFKCAECGVLTDITDSPYFGVSLPNYDKWKELKS